MKKFHKILSLLALVLILGATIRPALAYFTTYTRAKGGYTIHQTATTTINEEFSDWTKSLTVTNTEGKPVYVRARAFGGSLLNLQYSGDGWTDGGDGWWYYSGALAEGQSAATLLVKIDNIPKAQEGTGFNVAVVYESTPVLYRTDGTAYADWTMILDKGGDQG